MESDRKYRQKGYMDSYREEKRERSPAPPKSGAELGGPKVPRMPGTRAVSRCAQCGTVLPVTVGALSQCLQCGFSLHSCKQCTHFDPASRFECTQPIPHRIENKTAENQCEHYEIRTTVEREASSGTLRADDARRAFDNLFKK